MVVNLTLAKKSTGIQKTKTTKTTKVSKLTPVFLMMILISLAGITYIFKVNQLATMGYVIREKENQIEELKEKNERFRIEAASEKSMDSLEKIKNDLKMKKPDQVGYIEVDNFVATAK